MSPRQEAFQLPVAGGERLCIWRAPAHDLYGRIVHVPAFADEMNRCRPMTAAAARRLAAAGYGVLEIDLAGCGDSSGEFGDASWQRWIDDIVAAIGWTFGRSDAPLWLWGTRAGALLASAVSHVTSIDALLLWQPVLAGRLHLTQFLRTRVAAEMLSERSDGGTRALRDRLAGGEALEVAGYRLSPALAASLDRAECAPAASTRVAIWLEVAPGTDATLSAVSQATAAAWRERSVRVDTKAVTGPAFWQTVETERSPALIDATVACMAAEAVHALSRDTVFP